MKSAGQGPILALSGANELLLAAVENQGLCYRFHNEGLGHNERMVALCEGLLADADLTLGKLEAVAVDLGPGSFTGQRISLAFAKGLSFALAKPLVGFHAFELWSHYFFRQNPAAEPLLVLIDGRKRRFYARLFAGDGTVLGTWDLDSAALYQEVLRICQGADFNVVGPGVPLFADELGRELRRQVRDVCDVASLALSMLELAGRRLREGSFVGPADGPFYLRKSDAEERGAPLERVEN
ncbi:MAG: tRNA (adenosine(37)-N6)-threonylcarbamoyltransferase complex dimerization subunit type 1 TsaB [Spirochaetota bacterium]